jgi:hypothetical protein
MTKAKPKSKAEKVDGPGASYEKLAKLKPGDPIPDDVRDLFLRQQKLLAAGRANYGKADKVLEQILARCEVGVEMIVEGQGKQPPQKMTLVDRFADTNAVWAGSSCKRLTIEAKDIKPQDRPAPPSVEQSPAAAQ